MSASVLLYVLFVVSVGSSAALITIGIWASRKMRREP